MPTTVSAHTQIGTLTASLTLPRHHDMRRPALCGLTVILADGGQGTVPPGGRPDRVPVTEPVGVALNARETKLLNRTLDRKEIEDRSARIEQITGDDQASRATKQASARCT